MAACQYTFNIVSGTTEVAGKDPERDLGVARRIQNTQMCAGTPSLTVLRLNGACKLQDDALVAVGAKCPLLEELCIR